MHAVDSESTNYATDDSWRVLHVLKAMAAKDHPFRRFEVGNLETLGGDKPLETRAALLDWNSRHYQA
eukprot:2725313-Amphidinium_carterae.1